MNTIETKKASIVRSGGHGVSEGGIVLDLSDMQALDIKVDQRTGWAEAGLTAGANTGLGG